MELSFILFSITIFCLILFRLVTTNTWTTGKKLLVGFISSIIFDHSIYLLSFFKVFPVDAFSVIMMHTPATTMGLIMVFLMYKQKL